MTAKEYKKILLDNLNDVLKPKDFKKTGSTFSRFNGDLTYYINLQNSQSSTADVLKATLNIEIASASLYRLQDTSLPEKDCRHYIKRIGYFLTQPQDKWWDIVTEQTAQQAAAEINSIITEKVLPEIEHIRTTQDLSALWRQGNCPGLTERQRKEYLSLLGQPSI